MLVNFMDISSILLPFGVIYVHWVYFVVILVSFSRFGMLHIEKSGNPATSGEFSPFGPILKLNLYLKETQVVQFRGENMY
jgi:hypothetical protein